MRQLWTTIFTVHFLFPKCVEGLMIQTMLSIYCRKTVGIVCFIVVLMMGDNCDVSKKNNDTLKASTVLANEFSDQLKPVWKENYGRNIYRGIFYELIN